MLYPESSEVSDTGDTDVSTSAEEAKSLKELRVTAETDRFLCSCGDRALLRQSMRLTNLSELIFVVFFRYL